MYDHVVWFYKLIEFSSKGSWLYVFILYILHFLCIYWKLGISSIRNFSGFCVYGFLPRNRLTAFGNRWRHM